MSTSVELILKKFFHWCQLH